MDEFMRAAMEEARHGRAEGGIPIGSVLVRQGEIIGRGRNRRVQEDDPMTHAEIDRLSRAGRIGSFRDTLLYSTLMPCYVCAGVVVQFGIPKVIVADSTTFPGAPAFMQQNGVDVVDLNLEEAAQLMRDFITAHPEL